MNVIIHEIAVVDFYRFGKGTFFTSAEALHCVRRHCFGKESASMLLTLLACCLFLDLTKLLMPFSNLNVRGPFHAQIMFP